MYTVYKLLPNDYDRYRKHLLALDPDSRYMRFGSVASDALINSMCDKFQAEWRKHIIFVIENEELDVIAAGHVGRDGDGVELALSVLKPYQNQGKGSEVLKRCIRWCQNRMITKGCMVCLATNTAVRKLAKKHAVVVAEEGEAVANIVFPAADLNSIVSETVDAGIAQADHLGKIQRNIARKMLFFK
jgi:GNAT superfamily N-acetyltransferase